MAEYIEREAVLEILTQYDRAHIKQKGKPILGIASMVVDIEDIPAADVRPVVRAHWKPGDIRNVTAVCSNCGRLRLGNGAEWATKLAYFCEKCGADMRPEPPEEET